MCRLFGVHALAKRQVHQPLIEADNALMKQSKCHQDGWGIAYYLRGVPHIMRSLKSAHADEDFHLMARSITSPTVVAHVRRATQGQQSLANCHPFQYGSWIMAHNGDCPFFEQVRSALISELDEEFKSHLHGTTDSEVIFALILGELKIRNKSATTEIAVEDLGGAVKAVVDKIELLYQKCNISHAPSLNLLLSNGRMLLGFRLGRTLHYSVSQNMDNPAFMICSEPLHNDDSWRSFAERQVVGVDQDLRLFSDPKIA